MGDGFGQECTTTAADHDHPRKTVTYGLHRQIEGVTKLSSSGFAEAIVGNM